MNADLRLSFELPRADFTLRIDLNLPAQGTTVLFGASGSGKTSVLRAVAGLERARRARIVVGGQVWHDDEAGICLPTHRRALGYVFQEASLFGHLDVEANLHYGLKRARSSGATRTLHAAVALLGIGHLLRRRPGALSGGERQRVALARALVTQPRCVLADEPTGNLDSQTAAKVYALIETLSRELGIAFVVVTHDLELASRADRTLQLRDGRFVPETVASRADSCPAARGVDVAR